MVQVDLITGFLGSGKTTFLRRYVQYLVAQAFRFSKLVLATPTYNADVFPFMKEFIHHLTERNYQNRTVAFIENGSWAPMAAKVMTKMLEGSKNLTYAATTVTVRGALNAASEAQLAALADELSR